MKIDEETLAQMNGKQACPPDAGPAWKAAVAAGIDVSLIEDALRMTPEERLEQHQKALNLVLEIEAARETHDPR